MRRDRILRSAPTVMLGICILTSATVMVKTVLAGPTQLVENRTSIAQTIRDIARSLGESNALADVDALRPGAITSEELLAQAVSGETAGFGTETGTKDVLAAESARGDGSVTGSPEQRTPLPHTGGGNKSGLQPGGPVPPVLLQPVQLVTNDRDAYLGDAAAETQLAEGMVVDTVALALCNEEIPYGYLATQSRMLTFHQTEVVSHGPGIEDAWSLQLELPVKDAAGNEALLPLTIVVEDSVPFLQFAESASGQSNTVDLMIEWGGDVPTEKTLEIETELGRTTIELEELVATGRKVELVHGSLRIQPTVTEDEYELILEEKTSGEEMVTFAVTDADGDVGKGELPIKIDIPAAG